MHIVANMFWRRIDLPGHDACRLERHGGGWRLDGATVFCNHDGRVARLDYRVHCDHAWHAQWGRVRGWIGVSAVDLSIARSAAGLWCINDQPMPELAHCVDLDLGFTPATNLLQLRRLNLTVGESAEAPAAWVDIDGNGLTPLQQHYERRSAAQYWYRAPRFDYAAMLVVTPDGFVGDYPELWISESSAKQR